MYTCNAFTRWSVEINVFTCNVWIQTFMCKTWYVFTWDALTQVFPCTSCLYISSWMQVLTGIAATLVLVYNAITQMFTFNSWTQWVTYPIPIYVHHLHLKFAYVLSTYDMPHPKSYCSNVFEEGTFSIKLFSTHCLVTLWRDWFKLWGLVYT